MRNEDKAYALAVDVVRDTLLKLFKRHIRSYDPGKYDGIKCPFLNWIYVAIARNAAEMARREGVIVEPMNDWDDMPSPDTKETFRWEEDIEPYLRILNATYREALELAYKEGLSRKEAAESSQSPCSEGAMKVRVTRALQEVKRFIKYRDGLPIPLQQAFNLTLFQGLPVAEAAIRAGCPEKDMQKCVNDINHWLAQRKQP